MSELTFKAAILAQEYLDHSHTYSQTHAHTQNTRTQTHAHTHTGERRRIHKRERYSSELTLKMAAFAQEYLGQPASYIIWNRQNAKKGDPKNLDPNYLTQVFGICVCIYMYICGLKSAKCPKVAHLLCYHLVIYSCVTTL